MGRHYSTEMDELPTTIDSAATRPIDPIDVKEFRGIISHPLVAVGVGGSTTAAHFAARLHRERVGLSARVATTLEYTRERTLPDEAALIVSAGGRNKDALAAYDVAEQHAREVAIWTVNAASPLAGRARKAGFPFVFDAATTAYKDGFLATNTLMSTLILGGRLYDDGCRLSPISTDRLSTIGKELAARRKDHEPAAWAKRDSILVLYGGWGAVAAADLESRLHESALAHVQLADLRNFAHGRHLWVAERGSNTSIVAFVSPSERALYQKLKRLLPDECPILELLATTEDWTAAVELVAGSMQIVEEIGRVRKRDPGRPSVPDWGRKVYGLGPGKLQIPAKTKRPLHHEHTQTATSEASQAARAQLRAREIRGVVLDLDGTLIERRDAGASPQPAIYSELNRLLREGLVLGLASGRGKSLFNDLHEAFDREFRDRIVLGFYNGAIIRRLSEGAPEVPKKAKGALRDLVGHLKRVQGTPPWFSIDEREVHLDVHAENPGDVRRLGDVVEAIITREDLPLSFGASSLGLDIFPKSASKLRVVNEVAKLADATPNEVLRIGDRGDRGGNDYEMLNHDLGLSVNMTHAALMTCQNLAPPGKRGPSAALYYLKHLTRTARGHQLKLEDE